MFAGNMIMKKQVQLRAFNLRAGTKGLQQDLATVNNYLLQAEVKQVLAMNGNDEGAVLLFLEYIKAPIDGIAEAVEEKVVKEIVLNEAQLKIVDKLKAWRSSKAAELQLPVFMVLNNMAIENIAIHLPETLTMLTAIKGMGPIRAQKYGREILELVNGVTA
jgi:ribonuclease D